MDVEIKTIVRLAGKYSSSVVPDELKQTFPIPNSDRGSLDILIFYTRISRYDANRKSGPLLYPAKYMVRVTYPDGEFVSLERVSETLPSDVVKGDGSLGEHSVSLSMDEYEQAFVELMQLYELLLNVYIEDVNSSDVTKEKLRFVELFNLISEKPYTYYYRTYGSQFFDWVGSS